MVMIVERMNEIFKEKDDMGENPIRKKRVFKERLSDLKRKSN